MGKEPSCAKLNRNLEVAKEGLRLAVYVGLALCFAFLVPGRMAVAEGQSLQVSSSPHVKIDPEALETFLDNYIPENMESSHIPGLVIVVVQGENVLLSKGYGCADLESKRPMTPEVAVRAGSVSKPVVATAVLQLWEQGLINLDAPISDYIADIDLDDDYGDASTVAQLLTHMAGYPDKIVLSHAPTIEEWDPLAEVLASDLPPRVFPPGKVMAYSSWDYALLGYAIEQIAGMPYEVAIAENLLNPLGMNDSSFLQPLPPQIFENLAVGYDYSSRDAQYKIVPYDFVRMSPGVALVTTADDMGKFMLALLNKGELGGSRILEEETVSLLWERQASVHPYSRGCTYGLAEKSLGGRQVLYHDGNGIGFMSRIILVPEHETGIFMSINHRFLGKRGPVWTPAAAMVDRLSASLLEEFIPETQAEIPEVQPLADAEDRLERYVGHYQAAGSSPDDFFKVSALMDSTNVRDNGDDTLRIGSGDYVEVEPLLFQNTESPGVFRVFIENDRGDVEFFSVGGTGTYQKAAWYHSLIPTVAIVGVIALAFLSMLIIWPRTRQGHWLVWVVSLLNVVFFVGVAMFFTDATDLQRFYKEIPVLVRALFALPWLSFALSLGLLVFVVQIWRDEAASVWGRVHYSVVTLASFIFFWLVNYWNLIL